MVKSIFFAIIFMLFTFPVQVVSAVDNEAGSTAQLASFDPLLVDERIAQLQAFLHSYNSPLEREAVAFIQEADRYSLDWRLVVAIAGTESTFGKHIPSGSYNAWGWGIPTGAQSGIGFESWTEGISTVSEGLRKNYINRGAQTIEQIGRIYAASPAWAGHVRFFINKLNTFTPTDSDFLDVTI